MPDHNVDVGHIAARLLAVTLPLGLTLDEVLIQGERLHLVHHPFSVSMPDPGSLEVRVSNSSLAEFMERKAPPGLNDFAVRLEEGMIHIDLKASMLISISVTVVCKLTIENRTKLFVELVRVESIGGSGIHNIVQRQIDSLNPILNAADLPIDSNLESVEADNNWLVLKGTIAPK